MQDLGRSLGLANKETKMLSALDETFLHQSPVTFDQTHLSDHRFFDRIWMGGCNDQGERFMMGMGVYKNTNTLDAYAVVLRGGKQFNVRASRAFLPRPDDKSAGPISVEIVEPLKILRVRVQATPQSPLAADVLFTGTIPACEENRHVRRVDGRLLQDYLRFDQIGTMSGWCEAGGERVVCTNWFAARDHSWGIRPGMGGYEAATSAPRAGVQADDIGGGIEGFLVVWLAFEAGDYAGYLQQLESGAGKIIYTDGHIYRRRGASQSRIAVRGIAHDLEFVPGTRVCSGGRLIATLEDGETLTLDVKAHLPPAVYKGGGYDFGFNDERGLGLHRGSVLEYDVYDVTHPEDVILPGGRLIRPWHRESTASLTANGHRGLGHFPIISTGTIERYRLSGAIINKV
jgi:hypothetical protein